MGVTEQPRASEDTEGKRKVNEGCCLLSRAGSDREQGDKTGLASVRPRSQVGPGRRNPRKKCEQKVAGRGGVEGAAREARTRHNGRRRGGDGMRSAPSLPDGPAVRGTGPRPPRCPQLLPHLRPPSCEPGRTGRRLRARAAATTPQLGSRRQGGAWRSALWERRGGSR